MTKNLKPDSGSISLYGKDISEIRLKDFARQAAIVHQYNTAPADLTVEKLVSYGRTPYHTLGLSPQCRGSAHLRTGKRGLRCGTEYFYRRW